MKTLLILRHAKSDRGDPSLADHERPLNKRGEQDAPQMGKLIKDENIVPELIISSSALRARMTAELAAKACQYSKDILLDGAIYADGVDSYIELLKNVPDRYNRVMVVGHNPDLEYLIQIFSQKTEPFPTSGLALFDVYIKSWQEMSLDVKATLINLWRPKEV